MKIGQTHVTAHVSSAQAYKSEIEPPRDEANIPLQLERLYHTIHEVGQLSIRIDAIANTLSGSVPQGCSEGSGAGDPGSILGTISNGVDNLQVVVSALYGNVDRIERVLRNN